MCVHICRLNEPFEVEIANQRSKDIILNCLNEYARIVEADEVLEQVNVIVYPGFVLSRDSRYTADVKRRV